MIFSLPTAVTEKPLTCSVPRVPKPPAIPEMALPSESLVVSGLLVSLASPPPSPLALMLKLAPSLTSPSLTPSPSTSRSPLPVGAVGKARAVVWSMLPS
ncbi:hypothetical protein Y695_04512 [Hydrogenophaga sp. T4]|nr:hypothetical protein Y695_04512 [Hydrogenophaga sp. T4]